MKVVLIDLLFQRVGLFSLYSIFLWHILSTGGSLCDPSGYKTNNVCLWMCPAGTRQSQHPAADWELRHQAAGRLSFHCEHHLQVSVWACFGRCSFWKLLFIKCNCKFVKLHCYDPESHENLCVRVPSESFQIACTAINWTCQSRALTPVQQTAPDV